MTTTIVADFVEPTGQTLLGVDQDAVLIEGSAWTDVTLNGEVRVTTVTNSFPVIGVRAGIDDTVGLPRTLTVGVTGAIHVNGGAPEGFSAGIAAEGLFAPGIHVLNQGVIDIQTVGEAWGVGAGSGGFDNRGMLTVSAQGNATGVMMESGGSFSNSGTISVTGATGAFQGAAGVVIYNSVATHEVDNSGTIQVVSDNASASVGLAVAGFTTVVNTGTIQADKAIVFVRDDNLVNGGGHHLDITNAGTLSGALDLDNGAGEPVALSNSGHVTGDVTLNNSADTLTNTGVLVGQVDLGPGADTFDGVVGSLTGDLSGGEGNDVIRGGAGAGLLDGGDGSDLIYGGRGAEALHGGNGNDIVVAVYNNTEASGGAGDDLIRLDGMFVGDPLRLTSLDGGDGDDSFVVYAFPGQRLAVEGGAGHNTLEMHYFGTGVDPIVVHLDGDASGGAWVGTALQTVTVVGHVADVVGGDANETITAPGVIVGGGGDDILTGSAPQAADPNQLLMTLTGADTIGGGLGNDTIAGLSGVSVLRGDEGDDSIAGGGQFDDINGNMGADTLHGAAGDDWVVGGKDNDVQFGDAGGDVVWGNLGDDTLDGGDGADQVRGGQGDDSVSGGAGADYVSGDRGNDTITGGTGADLFHGSQDAGIDRVLDFHIAEGDRVMLDPGTTYTVSQVGADTVIAMGGGNQMILVGVQMSTLTGDWIFEG